MQDAQVPEAAAVKALDKIIPEKSGRDYL